MMTFAQNLSAHLARWSAYFMFGAVLGSVDRPNAHAQLVITEVMSSGSTNCTGVGISYPDFWELTNLGDDPVDLAGYRFWDADPTDFKGVHELPNISIAPGESIIFVRENRNLGVTDATAFRAWWGDANLPPNLQVYFYKEPGFNGDGDDGVRLWDANTNLVDEVYFHEAVVNQGISFVADTNTCEFGARSQEGVCGAFRGPCGDIGSPGVALCVPRCMSITQQPVSQTVDAGSPVTFRVRVAGRPVPRGYQWFFNGTAIPRTPPSPDAIPVVVNYAGCGLAWTNPPKPSDLVIPEVQPSDAGDYFVVLTNGLQTLTSAVVTLTVNTNPITPQIECPATESWFPLLAGQPQTNLVLSPYPPGQRAIFDVRVRAYPPPTFRWSFSPDGTNFVAVANATNRSLVIDYATTGHAGTYRVRVQNTNGTNYAYATLTVKPKPALRITEAMSYPCPGSNQDWWELTNTGDEPVNLTGYRWNDYPQNLGGGPTITNAVVIQPGESVILVESLSRESFIQWWGADNLPPHLQCITYNANGLSEDGEAIRLWNQSASDRDDWIDSRGFDRAIDTRGASFWFDQFCEPGGVSAERVCGAFRAANGCDVGSPGWTGWTRPCLTEIRRQGAFVRLLWKAQPGSRNKLQFTRKLATPPNRTVWMDLGGIHTFAEATGTATDAAFQSDPQRFYRIVKVEPADCPCQ